MQNVKIYRLVSVLKCISKLHVLRWNSFGVKDSLIRKSAIKQIILACILFLTRVKQEEGYTCGETANGIGKNLFSNTQTVPAVYLENPAMRADLLKE